MNIKRYSEMVNLKSFDERFEYLKLSGRVGEDTFGFDRVFNQMFYKSREWRQARREVIIRDSGCDLGIEGYEIYGNILVHHMNPISIKDIENRSDILLNPNYLITISHNTHNAITYGNAKLLNQVPIERTRNDTCPWKR